MRWHVVTRHFRQRSTVVSGIVAAMVGLSVSTAQAESQDLDTLQFKPAVGAFDILQVQSPRISTARRWSLFFESDYAWQPFRYQEADDSVTPFIQERMALTVGGSFAATDWLEFGVLVPTAPIQSMGVSPRTDPHFSGIPTSGFGDLMLVPKAEILETPAFALGVSAPVTVPTHKANAFLGRDDVTVRPRVLADLRREGGARLSASAGMVLRNNQSFLEADQGNALDLGVAGMVPFWLGRHEIDVVASVAGELTDMNATGQDSPAELLAGLKWSTPWGFQVSAGGGPGLSHAAGTPEWRAYAAIGFTPPDADSQRELALARLAVELADRDGDGIRDREDRCPDAAETVNGVDDQDGCPDDKVIVDKKQKKIIILEEVYFAVDKDVILPVSFGVLDQVAATLKSHPDISHVRIEGHTDDTGTEDYNLDLSQRRADNVRQFLMDAGIGAGRLTAVGYGESRPVVANDDDAGRAANRRVEFIIVESKPVSTKMPATDDRTAAVDNDFEKAPAPAAAPPVPMKTPATAVKRMVQPPPAAAAPAKKSEKAQAEPVEKTAPAERPGRIEDETWPSDPTKASSWAKDAPEDTADADGDTQDAADQNAALEEVDQDEELAKDILGDPFSELDEEEDQ